MPERYFAAGEISPRLIADAWADLNNCEHGQGDALLYEIEVRRLIEAGIEAGKITCRGGHPKYAPAPADVAFEDCYFEWEEIRAWVKEYDGESWPLVPPWMAAQKNHSNNLAEASKATRRPAKVYGEGFSPEQQEITTLARYLELETWTPLWASLLVCGIQPPQGCTEIPAKGAMGLDSQFIDGSWDRFHEARWILELWESRENAPVRVRPADFVAWCKSKGINTDWLSDVPGQDQAATLPLETAATATEATTDTTIRHNIATRRRELSAEIELAIKNAANPDDPNSAWDALCEMADRRATPKLLGLDDDGVKYRKDNGEPGWMNKRAFIARWNRRNGK